MERVRVRVQRQDPSGNPKAAHSLGWTRWPRHHVDELHVTDGFQRLVGPISRVPASQFARLIAIALLLRPSAVS